MPVASLRLRGSAIAQSHRQLYPNADRDGSDTESVRRDGLLALRCGTPMRGPRCQSTTVRQRKQRDGAVLAALLVRLRPMPFQRAYRHTLQRAVVADRYRAARRALATAIQATFPGCRRTTASTRVGGHLRDGACLAPGRAQPAASRPAAGLNAARAAAAVAAAPTSARSAGRTWAVAHGYRSDNPASMIKAHDAAVRSPTPVLLLLGRVLPLGLDMVAPRRGHEHKHRPLAQCPPGAVHPVSRARVLDRRCVHGAESSGCARRRCCMGWARLDPANSQLLCTKRSTPTKGRRQCLLGGRWRWSRRVRAVPGRVEQR